MRIDSIQMCSKNSTNLQKFHLKIKQHEMYAEDEPLVDLLLQEMATGPIERVRTYHQPFRREYSSRHEGFPPLHGFFILTYFYFQQNKWVTALN